eukprot:NODE_1840_length_1786_cov_11.181600_g1560_i0.p1 GENE.NODE_1840_length_1786_cov_11.181600_g1560_i0~~NODE_1840_length_1786_cov_11.181600_g1560_i0.p1  ORF type:complete len:516 (-),score=59.93 NODE_1840_length_1786_cov_11.181600_g1560_i0:188-1735(-)
MVTGHGRIRKVLSDNLDYFLSIMTSQSTRGDISNDIICRQLKIEIYEELCKKCNLVVIFDTCHSGGMSQDTEGDKIISIVDIDNEGNQIIEWNQKKYKEPSPNQNYVNIVACGTNQEASDGAFSTILVDSLNCLDGQCSYQQLHELILRNEIRNVYNDTIKKEERNESDYLVVPLILGDNCIHNKVFGTEMCYSKLLFFPRNVQVVQKFSDQPTIKGNHDYTIQIFDHEFCHGSTLGAVSNENVMLSTKYTIDFETSNDCLIEYHDNEVAFYLKDKILFIDLNAVESPEHLKSLKEVIAKYPTLSDDEPTLWGKATIKFVDHKYYAKCEGFSVIMPGFYLAFENEENQLELFVYNLYKMAHFLYQRSLLEKKQIRKPKTSDFKCKVSVEDKLVTSCDGKEYVYPIRKPADKEVIKFQPEGFQKNKGEHIYYIEFLKDGTIRNITRFSDSFEANFDGNEDRIRVIKSNKLLSHHRIVQPSIIENTPISITDTPTAVTNHKNPNNEYEIEAIDIVFI